jgi:hypothetical protein
MSQLHEAMSPEIRDMYHLQLLSSMENGRELAQSNALSAMRTTYGDKFQEPVMGNINYQPAINHYYPQPQAPVQQLPAQTPQPQPALTLPQEPARKSIAGRLAPYLIAGAGLLGGGVITLLAPKLPAVFKALSGSDQQGAPQPPQPAVPAPATQTPDTVTELRLLP